MSTRVVFIQNPIYIYNNINDDREKENGWTKSCDEGGEKGIPGIEGIERSFTLILSTSFFFFFFFDMKSTKLE